HGFPWKGADIGELQNHGQLVVANGPHLPGSAVVLVENHPQGAVALAQHFLPGSARLRENLELLGQGEGIVIAEDAIVYTTWHSCVEGEGSK
ncbi:MAG: hypothetical protein L0332_24425, partial [Chloroflexi bacterium]|nr:hypothetical protein [Chloroflexota bacterium]MCI0729842.1 hypothetical protein [Chloroflexota bacterium]